MEKGPVRQLVPYKPGSHWWIQQPWQWGFGLWFFQMPPWAVNLEWTPASWLPRWFGEAAARGSLVGRLRLSSACKTPQSRCPGRGNVPACNCFETGGFFIRPCSKHCRPSVTSKKNNLPVEVTRYAPPPGILIFHLFNVRSEGGNKLPRNFGS